MKLLRLGSNEFMAYTDNREYYSHGSFDLVARFMVLQGIKDEEIEHALIDMGDKKANVAHFGINNQFMFCTTQDMSRVIESVA